MNKPIGSLNKEYHLVNDTQDAEEVRRHIGEKAADFDSFFVKVENGDYVEVWGFEGIVPCNWKRAWRVLP